MRTAPHSRAAVRPCEDKKRHGGSENLLICRCIPSWVSVEGPRNACVSEHVCCAGRRGGARHYMRVCIPSNVSFLGGILLPTQLMRLS